MGPRKLEQRLEEHSPVVLDGAMATELERRGCNLDDPLWSTRALIDTPEMVLDVHRAYVAAGADVITTASYQATFAGLARSGVAHGDAADLLRRSVALARAATLEADDPPLVAASIGSYGAFLADGSEYRGDYDLTLEELVAFHRERLDVLTEGADLLAFETVPSAVEAAAISELLSEEGPDAWVAFTSRRPGAIADGTDLVDAVAPLCARSRVVAVGVNCSAPALIEPAIAALRAVFPREIVVYPNSGEDWGGRQGGWRGQGVDVDAFRAAAASWIAMGATLVGGCCRTGPEHVRALVELRESDPH